MSMRKWREIFIILCCILLLGGCSQTSQPSPEKTITHLNTKNTSDLKQIDPNFVGLSLELAQVCEVIRLDNQNPTYYEQLYRNLGSSVIRIGGNSVDFGVWSPYENMSCSSTRTVVNQEMIYDFFAFIERIHWKVIWGLNLRSNDPQSATNEAYFVATVGGSDLLAFTIGNEPDLYVQHGFRSANKWGYFDYRSEWETYYDSILGSVPTAKFINPDACCETSFFYNFTHDERDKIIATAHHYYATAPIAGNGETEDIPFLLSQRVSDDQTQRLSKWVTTANQAEVPLEITESNTFSGGGVSGVSDTYASALWAVDYLCEASSLGVTRVEFHNSVSASYNVINDDGNPTSLYYGLLLFHTLVKSPGSAIEKANIQTPFMVTAYEVIDAEGVAHMVLINKDLTNAASVEIYLDKSYRTAQLLRLTAPAINATHNITLGGRAVSDRGTWSASSLEAVDINGSMTSISVPSGSAVEVTFV